MMDHLDHVASNIINAEQAFSVAGHWPRLAAGDSSLHTVLQRLLEEVFDVGRYIPSGTSSSRGPTLAMNDSHEDQFRWNPPLVRWQWACDYKYMPASGVAAFPYTDLFRARMWPLIAHEVGHSVISAARAQESGLLNKQVSETESSLLDLLANFYDDVAANWMPKGSLTKPIQLQAEELLADAFATRLFGGAYFDAFSTFVIDRAALALTDVLADTRDITALPDLEDKLLFAYCEAMPTQHHPPMLLRLLTIAASCDHAQSWVGASTPQFDQIIEQLPKSDGWSQFQDFILDCSAEHAHAIAEKSLNLCSLVSPKGAVPADIIDAAVALGTGNGPRSTPSSSADIDNNYRSRVIGASYKKRSDRLANDGLPASGSYIVRELSKG